MKCDYCKEVSDTVAFDEEESMFLCLSCTIVAIYRPRLFEEDFPDDFRRA